MAEAGAARRRRHGRKVPAWGGVGQWWCAGRTQKVVAGGGCVYVVVNRPAPRGMVEVAGRMLKVVNQAVWEVLKSQGLG